jgi:hypothetical protein
MSPASARAPAGIHGFVDLEIERAGAGHDKIVERPRASAW